MNITNEILKSEMLNYFKVRAEDKKINNIEEYEKQLYKVIVQHFTVFEGQLESISQKVNDNEFEYVTWMAAVEYYEVNNDLPRLLSKIRFKLARIVNTNDRHENLIVWNKDIIALKYRLPTKYKALSSYSEYEFFTYKSINETFSEKKQPGFDPYYWGILARLYELENKLPLIYSELINLERNRGIRKLREKNHSY